MVVGLNEMSNNVNQEMQDVGSAFSQVNQHYLSSYAQQSGKATE